MGDDETGAHVHHVYVCVRAPRTVSGSFVVDCVSCSLLVIVACRAGALVPRARACASGVRVVRVVLLTLRLCVACGGVRLFGDRSLGGIRRCLRCILRLSLIYALLFLYSTVHGISTAFSYFFASRTTHHTQQFIPGTQYADILIIFFFSFSYY